jgi:MFS family permease
MAGPAVVRRNTRRILAGQAVSLLGDYIAVLALPLFVLELSGSALDLGLTTAFETLPTLLFGFAVGVALDRIPLRRALVVADVGRAAGFIALAVAAASDAAAPWMVFAVAFLVGSLAVGFDSGLQAWLPSLVPDDTLVVVNARIQLIRTAAWSVGPPLAGFLASGPGGFATAFSIDAATFVVSAAFVLALTEIAHRPSAGREAWLPSFTAGIKYLAREQRLRAATLGATAANTLFVPMEALLVLFATEALGIGDTALIGWFFAGHSLLGALGVAAAPRIARRIGLGPTFVLGLVMLGGGFLSLTLASDGVAALPDVAAVVVAAVPAGLSVAGVSFTNVAFSTLRQQIPPPELRGRVIAATRTFAWAGLPVGAALGGLLGERVGAEAVYIGASFSIIAVGALLSGTRLVRVSAGS